MIFTGTHTQLSLDYLLTKGRGVGGEYTSPLHAPRALIGKTTFSHGKGAEIHFRRESGREKRIVQVWESGK